MNGLTWSTQYPELVGIEENPFDPIGVVIRHNVSKAKLWLDMKQGADFEIIDIHQNYVVDEELLQWHKADEEESRIYTREDQEITTLLQSHQNIIGKPEEIILNVSGDFMDIPQLDEIPFEAIPLQKIGLQIDEYRRNTGKEQNMSSIR